ncbi:hypothetical protein GCM10027411_14740 [Microbacterium aureliae]
MQRRLPLGAALVGLAGVERRVPRVQVLVEQGAQRHRARIIDGDLLQPDAHTDEPREGVGIPVMPRPYRPHGAGPV